MARLMELANTDHPAELNIGTVRPVSIFFLLHVGKFCSSSFKSFTGSCELKSLGCILLLYPDVFFPVSIHMFFITYLTLTTYHILVFIVFPMFCTKWWNWNQSWKLPVTALSSLNTEKSKNYCPVDFASRKRSWVLFITMINRPSAIGPSTIFYCVFQSLTRGYSVL